MQLFYIPSITPATTTVTLPPDESKHCFKVLRYQVGGNITLIDGKGHFYFGIVSSITNKSTVVAISKVEKQKKHTSGHLHIAIAPTKNSSRFEHFLEKATEIGIDEITPIICEHSERKMVKIDRLNRVIIAAIKQSIKATLPLLNEAVSFNKLVESTTAENKFIAYCDNVHKEELFHVLKNSNTTTLILIGPEGDFSPEEIAHAKKRDFQVVSLGKNRLRTETAGIVACHTFALKNSL